MITPLSRPRFLSILVALLFALTGFAWAQVTEQPIYSLTEPISPRNPVYSRSLAVRGKWVVVGSPAQNSYDEGLVFVYDLGSASPTTAKFVLHNPIPNDNDGFGYAVAATETKIAVLGGAATKIYDLASSDPTMPVRTLPGGSTIAASGSRIIVGTDQGASIYDLATDSPQTPVAILEGPVALAVAISETYAVIGHSADIGDQNGDSGGSAYVYDLRQPTSTPTAILRDPHPSGT